MQNKSFIRSIFRNGPSDLQIRKPAVLPFGNGVNRISFHFTPITTGNIFSRKKLLTNPCHIEEIKIKTLELFFTLDNVVDNRLTQIQECIIKCMTKCCIGIKAPFSFSKYSLYNDFNRYKFKSTVY